MTRNKTEFEFFVNYFIKIQTSLNRMVDNNVYKAYICQQITANNSNNRRRMQ